MHLFTRLTSLAFIVLFSLVSVEAAGQAFVTTWKTDNTGVFGSTSNPNQITIPTTGTGYNYDVDWGDGETDTGVTGTIVHTYPSPGTYTVSITGDFPRIYFNASSLFDNGDHPKILSVEAWGDIAWQSMESAFAGCNALRINASDTPDLTNVTDMSGMFARASSMNDDISSWDVSNVTLMFSMFENANSFNQSLNGWDVRGVTNMSAMFSFASAFNSDLSLWQTDNLENTTSMFVGTPFNQNINNWNMSKVTGMSGMFSFSNFNQPIGTWNVLNVTSMSRVFEGNQVFNQDISEWDVDNVTTMSRMFADADAFNSPLPLWNVSSVIDMSRMFDGASTFNQDISQWDVDNVTDMSGMFANTDVFNQDISSWQVQSVQNMSEMFNRATAFNQNIGGWVTTSLTNISSIFSSAQSFDQDINNWNVSGVTNMSSAFSFAPNFNQNLNSWVTSNVTTMERMFRGAASFNGNIIGWDVSQVTNMQDMFRQADIFNQDISGWDVSAVQNMISMFQDAAVFNQDISGWNTISLERIQSMFSNAANFNQNLGAWDLTNLRFGSGMFDNSGLSPANYDATLIGWNTAAGGGTVPDNVTIGAAGILYCEGAAARQELIDNNSWDFQDDEFGCISVYNGASVSDPRISSGQATPIDFGSVGTLISKTRTFNIRNELGIPLTNLSVSITNSGTGFDVDTPPITDLDVASESQFVIRFGNAPISTYNETLTISADEFSGGDFTYDLTGIITATPGPEITVFRGDSLTNELSSGSSTYFMGSALRGNNILGEFTILNKGSAPLSISDIFISGSDFTITSSIPTAIDVDGTVLIQVQLDGSVGGFFNETVSIESDDLDEDFFTFNIGGEIIGPDIAVYQGTNIFSSVDEIFDEQITSVDIGSGPQGTDIIEQITLANFSVVDLDVSGISISGSAFSINSPPSFTIDGEEDAVIQTVTFELTLSGLTTGTFNETVTITNDDDDENPFTFPISGTIGATSGTIRYVKWDATGNNDGTTWTDAFTDFQDALAASVSQDAIWIAAGVYTPDLSDPGNTSLTFNIPSDELRIYGGFNGTESLLSERIGDPSLTILSGDLNGDDGPAFANTSDNSENVLTVNGLIVYIDDLTITGGNTPTNGGGLLANNAEVYITNAVLENNQSLRGGGAYLDAGSIELQNTVLRNNEAGSSGGGAYVINAEAYLFRTTFESNEATNGAGLYLENTNQVNNPIFYYNQFINNGQNTAVRGGAIYVNDSYYESFGSLLINNYAYDAGGAIYASNSSILRLTNSTFGNNASNDTSADIFIFTLPTTSTLSIYNSIFWGGTSIGRTGSLASINDFGASFEIQNSIVQDWDPSEYSIAPVATNVSDTDPQFTDAAGADFTLSNSSAAINMGDNTFVTYLDVEDEDGDMDFSELAPFDLAGNPRFVNSVIDIGAYENQFLAAAPEIAVFSSSGIEVLDGTGLIDLGSQVQGSGINETISLNNTGASSLEISTIVIPAPFVLNSALSFPLSVPSGGSQLVDIFLPGSTVGTFTETIIVNSNDSDEAMFDFQITGEITATNTAPTLSTIPDVTIDEGGSSDEIPFTIGDSETSINDLTISVTSDNLALVPLTGIVISGSGASRTIAITPEPNLSGTAIITVSVDDGTTITSQSFTVTVLAINDLPSISNINDVTIDEDASPADITFSVSDNETNLDDLIITAVSDNDDLISTSTIQITGTGADRVISYILTPDVNGIATVTVTVDDGEATVSESFTVTVNAINDAPIITGSDTFTTPVNTPIELPLSAFTVVDVDNEYPTGFSIIISEGSNYTASGTTVSPDLDFVGSLTVPIVINDGQDDSPVFDAIITVIQGEISVDIGGEPLATGDIINFDDIPVGARDARELVITNSGTSTLVISEILIDGEDFRLDSPVPDPIPAGANATISIVFQPSSVGAKTATLTVRSESAADFDIILRASGLSDIPPIEIFNVVTTQQNGKHDFLEIRNIEFYESNRVYIYSRWGNEVFKTENYNNTDNRFIGNSDGGEELVDGTYYYVIELNGGETVENGFFLLRR